MKTFDNYVYFLYIGNNPNYSFRSYMDAQTGHERGYVVGYTDKGQPLFKEWMFNFSNRRQIRINAKEEDKTGQKAVDFLRNSPEFLNSPNGTFVQGEQVLYKFKEINDEKDALEAVATRSMVINAQKKALELKGQNLKDVAAVLGIFSDKEGIIVHKVLDFSANKPEVFISIVDDPTLKIRSLVKKALNDGVFVQDGRIIKWEGKQIGVNEDDAVSALVKDTKLKDAIELNLQKFGSA